MFNQLVGVKVQWLGPTLQLAGEPDTKGTIKDAGEVKKLDDERTIFVE